MEPPVRTGMLLWNRREGSARTSVIHMYIVIFIYVYIYVYLYSYLFIYVFIYVYNIAYEQTKFQDIDNSIKLLYGDAQKKSMEIVQMVQQSGEYLH